MPKEKMTDKQEEIRQLVENHHWDSNDWIDTINIILSTKMKDLIGKKLEVVAVGASFVERNSEVCRGLVVRMPDGTVKDLVDDGYICDPVYSGHEEVLESLMDEFSEEEILAAVKTRIQDAHQIRTAAAPRG